MCVVHLLCDAVDVCGVCNGTAIATDMHGHCCSSVPAANHVCCDEGEGGECRTIIGVTRLDLYAASFK